MIKFLTLLVLLVSIFLLPLGQTKVERLGKEYFGNTFKVGKMEPLLGGSVNPIFKIETEKGSLVFRFGPDWQNGKEFLNEVNATQAAAEAGISPYLYYFSPHSKGMIMDYILSDSLPDLSEDERNASDLILLIAEQLRNTHALPVELLKVDTSNIDPYAIFLNDEQKFKAQGFDFGSDYHEALGYIKEVKKSLETSPSALIHKDLHGGNILVANNNASKKVYFIDWTFVSYGDPYFDVAKAAYSLQDKESLLRAYVNGEPTPDQLSHFYLMYSIYLLERYFEWLEQAIAKQTQGQDGVKELDNAAKAFQEWRVYPWKKISFVQPHTL